MFPYQHEISISEFAQRFLLFLGDFLLVLYAGKRDEWIQLNRTSDGNHSNEENIDCDNWMETTIEVMKNEMKHLVKVEKKMKY